ncbi:MAG: PhoD-like phosphatase [Microcoleus sp. SIO2G3]|nr:PhoD-like phosphatase [Microcoleus sp. SIO2G3]
MRSGDHIEHLPLILVGPILRHTESNAVTVWIALKAPREVTLKVYATQDNGSTIKTVLLEGTRSTVPLGKYLHIVAVTAKPVNEEDMGKLGSATPSGVLKPGQIYAYDLSFGSQEQNLAQALQLAIQSPRITVSYFEHQLPTFAMPPEDLNHLRLAHGSCRKLHGGGHDALPILDDLIEHYAKEPNSRLHQLFFTGDQIYGDDVADPLLWVATDVGDTLLGWEENLPFQIRPTGGYESRKPSELKPGTRTDIAKDYAGLTAMLLDTPEEAKSHLFSMGEYFSVYMLVWSPILWPDRFPLGKDIHKDSKLAKSWDREAVLLKECFKELWKVRRAMANVPVYMICDDHDLSDDWYLNRAWCNSVLGNPLGKRVVQNGLLAYAVFQAWGNTPDQFQEGQPGGNLLKAAALWSASAGTDESASVEIAKCLGLPQMEPETGLPKFKVDEDVLVMDRDYPDGTQPIEWHYTIRSLKHEVIVLDTRTWRGYPQGKESVIDPPMLLCPSAFNKQIQKPLEFTNQLNQSHESNIEATFIVVPTNLVSLRIIDIVQQWELEKGNVFDSDVGDAWNLHEFALSRLLAELFKRRQQVVVLSGDIHFAGAIRISYWARRHLEPPRESNSPLITIQGRKEQNEEQRPYPTGQVLAQLTASAFKNSELKTYFIHTRAKSLAPEQPQDWVGWNEPPQLVEIQVTQETVRVVDVELPATGPVVRQILGAQGNWGIAWEIALKDAQCRPDWQYHVEWLKRGKATLAPWEGKQESSTPSEEENPGLLRGLGNRLSILWRNQWLQEGEEVIGHSNFGVISFEWSPNHDEGKAVIQDSFWRPPWKPRSVVYSRYYVPLHVDDVPPLPKVVSPNLFENGLKGQDVD